ncbi:MAG: PP2C family protein-serine/threonine phosphatase [Balneolaceae bacterium]|nr:PP2C family protein-serine/threonine phosphatase [Balneolaceae bacterium]
MGQRLTYWIFLGVLGLAAFVALRPVVDFNAGAPIEESRSAVEARTDALAERLGFDTDSLSLLTLRTQHLNYYRTLRDSVGEELPGPGTLNERGTNLTGWKVTVGSRMQGAEEGYITSNEDLFDQAGQLQLRYDRQGKVYRLQTNPSEPNPTFVEGEDRDEVARRVVGDIFGYNLDNYALGEVVTDSLSPATETAGRSRPLESGSSRLSPNLVYSWNKVNPSAEGPDKLRLEFIQTLREGSDPFSPTVVGAAVEDFQATGPYQPERMDSSGIISNLNLIVGFGSIGVLICLVFFTGIRHINRGQVEWKRAIMLFGAVALGVLGWRAIFVMNTWEPFLSDTGVSIYLLNQILFAAVVGLYGALAYVGWEAMAREQEQPQVKLVDAFWRKRFFFRETGDGLLRGYALGGLLLGLFAVALWLLDSFYYQADSQFGYMEPTMQPKLLTLNMGAWINVWLVALGHVGVAVGFLAGRIRRTWLNWLTVTAVAALLFCGSATLVGIYGPIWINLLVCLCLAPPIVYAFRRSGLFTFATGWWLFVVVLMVPPYLGSGDMDVAYVGWIQLTLIALPAIYGFVSLRYAPSVAEMAGYIPEYQERLSNHMRMEKEIEIARESQFKLMPLQPPVLEGVDVYGFFIPSFEVGGDYFDYVVGTNGAPDQQVLTMTIADVSGKAMKAAMHAVFTSGLLLSRLHRDRPEAILQEVSPTIFSRTDPRTFITCVIAQYHLEKRTLSIANAGHCLPILKRNGSAEFIHTPEPRYPLGVRRLVNYTALETQLKEGDFVLFYSDGLPEAVDPEGRRFGYKEVLTLVNELDTDAKSSSEIAQEIKRIVQKFSDYQLADDTTIICLKV